MTIALQFGQRALVVRVVEQTFVACNQHHCRDQRAGQVDALLEKLVSADEIADPTNVVAKKTALHILQHKCCGLHRAPKSIFVAQCVFKRRGMFCLLGFG